MAHRQIRRHCVLDESGQELVKTAITGLGLPARAYDRVLKVSRTIADPAGSDAIAPDHVSEGSLCVYACPAGISCIHSLYDVYDETLH